MFVIFDRSALHFAAATGNVKALAILMQSGLAINVDIKDNDGRTPLFKVILDLSIICFQFKLFVKTCIGRLRKPTHAIN